MTDSPLGAWELPEELRLLQQTVRDFMNSEVRPREDRWPHDCPGAPAEDLAVLQAKARASGLWAMQTPVEFGGAGLSVLGQVVVAEEAAKCRMGAFFPAAGAFGGNPPSVLFKASPEQFEKFGRPIIEGTMTKAFTAISEAAGGSDPARAIRCRAERQGDSYVLNGTKLWTSHAAHGRLGRRLRAHGRAGAARRHQLLHRREGHAGTDHGPDRRDELLLAVRAALRERADPRREPHRRGGRRVRARFATSSSTDASSTRPAPSGSPRRRCDWPSTGSSSARSSAAPWPTSRVSSG